MHTRRSIKPTSIRFRALRAGVIHVMASQIFHVDQGALSNETAEKCHLMPCSIDHDGDAPVDLYFTPCITKDGDNYRASFRGRPLHGKEIIIPNGYKGVVVEAAKPRVTDQEERSINATRTFSSFTYWNWDRQTSTNDNIVQAMDWITIAEAIHRPNPNVAGDS